MPTAETKIFALNNRCLSIRCKKWSRKRKLTNCTKVTADTKPPDVKPPDVTPPNHKFDLIINNVYKIITELIKAFIVIFTILCVFYICITILCTIMIAIIDK